MNSIPSSDKLGDAQISEGAEETSDFFPGSQRKAGIGSVMMTENMSQQSVCVLQERKTSFSPRAVS